MEGIEEPKQGTMRGLNLSKGVLRLEKGGKSHSMCHKEGKGRWQDTEERMGKEKKRLGFI